MGTLLLSNSDVKKLLEIPQLLPWIKKGFQAYSLSKSSVPVERFRCALPQSPNSSVVVLFPGNPSGDSGLFRKGSRQASGSTAGNKRYHSPA